MKASILSFLALLFGTASSDCIVEGDMVFVEGQSSGHFGLECLNSTSYDATDTVCGPNGTMIQTDAVYTCPTSDPESDPDGLFASPYCVQCGPRGIGAALCLSSPDLPSECVGADDGLPQATTTPPTTIGTTIAADGPTPSAPPTSEGGTSTTPSPTVVSAATSAPSLSEGETSTTLSPTVVSAATSAPSLSEGETSTTLSPTVVCGVDEEGCIDANYMVTYCIPASEGPCPCPENMIRCPTYDWGTYTTGGYCQQICCDDGPNATEVACPSSSGSVWQIPYITYCEPVSVFPIFSHVM
ncbi:hypothetical protein ACHAXA_002745 [Cyclostephanos tholiformis]|uniref:Uncharacterized protein n=1 Tax=Cyclostephanos tholiformis TaxID=382380 RepID=A0ABD3RKV1_9STRA